MGIKKSVILVLNNKKTSTVLSDNLLGVSKANILVTSAPTSSVIQSDQIRKGIVRPVRISSSVIGTGGSAYAFQLDENYTLSDQIQLLLQYIRVFDESVTSSELTAFVVEKPLEEVIQLFDQINISASKVLLDEVTSSSEGLLISQSYTLGNSYFFEDYVGESRTIS